VKERVEEISGCRARRVLEALDGLPGTISVFLEGFSRWVDARVEVWRAHGLCRLVRIGFVGLRIWSEMFEVCVLETGDGGVRLLARRVGGVGRLSVDFVVSLILNRVFEACPEAEVVGSVG